MIQHIQLKKGLNIPIKGEAELKIEKSIISEVVSVKPTNFKNLTPKLLVREGDSVKAGSILFIDKYSDRVDGVKLSFLEFIICGVLSMILMFIFEKPKARTEEDKCISGG